MFLQTNAQYLYLGYYYINDILEIDNLCFDESSQSKMCRTYVYKCMNTEIRILYK